MPNPPKKTGKPGLAARHVAVRMMTEVTEHGRLLSELLPKAVIALEPSDRARAQRLATESLRWAGRTDRLLGPYVRRKPEDTMLNLLRLAVWEMLGDGALSHGVVDCAVSIARKENPKAAGMVNAVLRNVMRGEPDWNALPVSPLPKWLRKPLVADHGKAIVAQIELAHAAGAPIDLTPKSGRGEDVAKTTQGVILPTGSVRLSNAPQVTALPGYDDGNWWVQDAAAAIPAMMLHAKPGERVLDLCAAPGGKTMQLADAGATVTALDISEKRLARLRDNLSRTGLAAEIVAADALDWEPTEPFDAVLLDAPCSATGTIRRHPELPHAKSADTIDDLVALQSGLFDRALTFVKPGGRLVFCTCSLLKAEGEDQLDAALARHPDLVVRPVDIAGIDPAWMTTNGGLRLRPDYWSETGGMDGFFVACLQKPA